VWRHFVGRSESHFLVTPNGASAAVTVSPGERRSPTKNEAWQSRWFGEPNKELIAGRLQILETAGRPRFVGISEAMHGREAVQISASTTYADVLPKISGLEKLEFISGFDLPTKNGDWQYGPGTLSAWKDGKWETVWTTEKIEYNFRPYPIVGDFDSDGELEVAVVPWRSLLVYDALTGKLEQSLEFTQGRSYGYFGVYDFDGNGTTEFLVASDFPKHVDILGYRDGRLTLLWQYEIEVLIDDPHTMMRLLPEPVSDFNGDGQSDVCFNVFDDREDGQWHLIVRDGMNGQVLADLAGEIAQQSTDLDGDGCSELFTIATHGRLVPRFGTIRVRSLKDNKVVTVSEFLNKSWQDHFESPERHQQYHVQHARLGALVRYVNETPIVVIRESLANRNDEIRLSLARWKNGSFDVSTTIEGGNLDALAIDDRGSVLVRCSTTPKEHPELRCSGGNIDYHDTIDVPGPVLPPITANVARPPHTVIVAQGASSELVAISPPRGDEPPVELWRTDGKLGGIGPSESESGRQIVYFTSASEGALRVATADLNQCRPLWHRDFERFASGIDVWNQGGALTCQLAHFTKSTTPEVLLTLQRSAMHSEEAFALSGRDGSLLWHRPRQIANRSCGGPFALADFNGDGFDDAASFFPSIHYILNGRDGSDLLVGENSWPNIPVPLVYWGQPIAGKFDRSGHPSLLFATYAHSMIGRMRSDGTLAWSDGYDEAPSGMPAIGDFDGDGAMEAMFIGCVDGTRCYDVETGKVKWKLSLGAKTDASFGKSDNSAASGDVNGDGRDEGLFLIGQLLHCIGGTQDGSSGQILWTVDLPCRTSAPILADVQSSPGAPGEHLSILLTGEDGYVYCIE
jgi:outer membrane protein assembly factor BamB